MKKWLLLSFLLFACLAEAASICLNMIVKDEKNVIVRCIKSVKPFIDYWVIVDTGSIDGTQDVIREFLSDVPGELHERPWVNFGHNRTEALKLAKSKGDYLLFIDADEEFEGTIDKKALSVGFYLAPVCTDLEPFCTFLRVLLIDNHLEWNWRGVIHESLAVQSYCTSETLQNAMISAVKRDGHRAADPQKYLKDAAVLQKALTLEPNNDQYAFYLAQSYYDAKSWAQALKHYEKRAEMEGWEQHTFWAKFYVGNMREKLEMDPALIIRAYCDAFQYRPTRAEPLARLANFFCNQDNSFLGYLVAQFALTIPRPDDIVYVEDWFYTHGIRAILANCAFKTGRNDEAAAACKILIQDKTCPEKMRSEAATMLDVIKRAR